MHLGLIIEMNGWMLSNHHLSGYKRTKENRYLSYLSIKKLQKYHSQSGIVRNIIFDIVITCLIEFYQLFYYDLFLKTKYQQIRTYKKERRKIHL